MSITQLIYMSQPFGFDDAMLSGILSASRRNNPARAITGCLVVRHDLYLQLIEGPEAAVEGLFTTIARDDRHLAVERLCVSEVHTRIFPDWAMRDDPARSWMWSAEEIEAGVPQAASQRELRAMFERIASEAE